MSRTAKVQSILKEQNLDALIVSSQYNLRYISNFTGSAGLSVITQDKAFFITDFRYTEQANDQAAHMTIIEHKGNIQGEIEKIIQDHEIKTIGFEKNHVTYSEYETMKERLSAELIPVENIIEDLRTVKDEDEIATIQKAVEITEKAFEHILDYIEEGMTEIQVANELDFYMRKLGASGVSFDTIVASGHRSAMPHGVASEKKIKQGDMITIDFGCYYNGYVSDMTRTFALGDPGEELKKIYQIVLDANLKATEAAKAGVTGAELDKIARDYITEHGYGDQFGHSLGHGIGLEVHEGPGINYRNESPLEVNTIITNEPGIYVAGLGGVRIEDDLVIEEDGNRNLMTLSKELIIL